LTSSSAVRRPPVRLEIVPPVATRRMRGASVATCAAGAGWARAEVAMRSARMTRLLRRRMHVGMERIQVPVEERPHAVPGVALLACVLRLPCLRVDAAVEGVAA